jgi:NAD(P)-dependent dehydrogenase (short-subunit alcohol dehydrogenase family)
MTTNGPQAKGRVAVVTGASQGTGRVVAERLFNDGFRVAIGDINAAGARTAAQEISADTESVIGLELDVADRASVEAFFQMVVDRFGTIDVLINNAGVVSLRPLEQLEEEEWDRVVDINMKGVYLCCRAAQPYLKDGGWGRVVNISSDVGKRGQALLTHYVASKFGVVGITQSLALEWAQAGITVNAICPAITKTPMMRQLATERASVSGGQADDIYEHLADVIPLGRATEPTDIANTIAWLVSDGAEFITGQSINVTGGRWMS